LFTGAPIIEKEKQMVQLTTKIGRLKLKNPIILGAGPLSGTASHIRKCVDAGFGAICAKTSTLSYYLQRYPRPLYTLKDYTKKADQPYYVPNDYMWMHREHNSVFPADKFVRIVKEASPYCKDHGTVLIGSFAGRGIDEWQRIVEAYAAAGADAMELNFCCPFPPKGLEEDERNACLGIYFSQHPEEGAAVIRKLKETVDIPLFPKLGPEATNFVEMVNIFKQAGADGVSLFANNSTLRIDIETGRPVNYGPCATTSNHLKSITMKWVSEIAQKVDLPILSGRGAMRWEDIIEYLMSGATGVEMCSAVIVRGLRYVKEVLSGVEAFMDRRGYKSVDDLRGLALKHILSSRQIIDETKALRAVINLKKCIGCRRCLDVCMYDAIQALPKKARIVDDKCAGCTLCTQVCPVSAIDVEERDNDRDHFRALAWEHKDLLPELFMDE
jgi:dihydroorotate dehydrogenase/NAD-dependent dihydropyrimidine dehydrogenase PreA subunit